MWRYFKGQHFSFWMICCYLFFEYFRPQSIFPSIDILPWAMIFILLSFVGAIIDPTVKWVSSPINKLLFIYSIILFLSSLTAYSPEISREHYIDFYSWLVVFFLIISIVNNEKRFYVFIVIFLICAAKIAIGTSKGWAFRGFSFTKWGLMGPQGYFQNSGELAILMLTLFPLAYLIYQYQKNKVSKFERYILIVFWVTPILTVLGASSRGAQIALAFQLLFMFRKSVFKIKPLVLISILIFSALILLPEEQKARFSSAGEDKTSVQRLLYWEHGLDMMKDYPILGVGYFNFPIYYERYYSEDMLYPNAQLPHNIFIQVGADLGIIALFVYTLMIMYPYLQILKLRKRHEEDFVYICMVGIAYGLMGFTFAGQFVSVVYYPFLWIGLAFFIAGRNILLHKEKGRYKSNNDASVYKSLK